MFEIFGYCRHKKKLMLLSPLHLQNLLFNFYNCEKKNIFLFNKIFFYIKYGIYRYVIKFNITFC